MGPKLFLPGHFLNETMARGVETAAGMRFIGFRLYFAGIVVIPELNRSYEVY
jgi:hypothetical protein